MLSGASGEFTGWGDAILHLVADSKSVDFYGIQISKHIIMLLISAFVTILLSVLATKKYRKKGEDKDQIPIVDFRKECRDFAEGWIEIQ